LVAVGSAGISRTRDPGQRGRIFALQISRAQLASLAVVTLPITVPGAQTANTDCYGVAIENSCRYEDRYR